MIFQKYPYKPLMIFVSYNSTGGKLSYSDYSGLLKITEAINAYTFGGKYLLKPSKTNDNLILGLRGFGMLSNMKINNYIEISENITDESIGFRSINYGIGARIAYEYPLSFFIIRASLGFDMTFGGTLKFKDNEDFHLENNNGDKVNTNWTGLRTAIGVTIPLKQ